MGANLNSLFGAVVLLTATVMILGIGLTVLGQLSVESRDDSVIAGEQVTLWVNNFTTLDNSFVTTSSATFVNRTSGTSISVDWNELGHYKGSSVRLSNSSVTYNGTLVNVSYTFGQSTDAQAAIDLGITGIDDFVTWIGIIVIALAGGVVFFLVLRSFTPKG